MANDEDKNSDSKLNNIIKETEIKQECL